ncbi:protein crumbs isoform X4 [Anopheles maculipalpis]|uniref:protein crumbs isoform X4 n=1 Tax=Anopheles maculipalpis TaxID=1496333 RepID=UPI0021596B51|nr:protein crumbs isoform X4 [Anopheles maculipalpis]
MRIRSLVLAPVTTLGVFIIVMILQCSVPTVTAIQTEKEAYFNGSAYLRLKTPMTLWSYSAISFKSCRGGEILSQRYSGHALLVSVLPDWVSIVLSTPAQQPIEARVTGRLLDNKWHTLEFIYQAGTLYCVIDKQSTPIANQSYNAPLILDQEIKNEAAVLILGKQYSGCLLHGPGLVFNSSAMNAEAVVFGPCPLAAGPCSDHDVLEGVPVDYCSHDPCMQHGTCISRSDSYECHCTARFKGKNCEIDMGPPCQSYPCQHGGTCSEDSKGEYRCTCAPGYTGVVCETELSVHPLCEKNPCVNNGTCRVAPGTNNVECDCLKGFIGMRCEINWDDCKSNVCLNGGRCIDGVDAFTCDCKGTGYGGTLCQNNIDECLTNPCQNGGTCFDTYGSFLCDCPSGFTGPKCQMSVNECKSQPCQNGGTCIDTREGFECRCIPGYNGALCELEPGCGQCPPDSECVAGRCVCKPGTTGMVGLCVEQVTAAAIATIATNVNAAGTSAQKSQALTNACASYCYNGASCVPVGTTAGFGQNLTCICASGYTGTRCESPIALPYSDECNCLNGGSCAPNGSTCLCPPGYDGPRCEQPIGNNLCNPSNCAEPYRCIGGKCQCPENMNCDNPCASSPCLHNGSCYQQGQSYACKCTSGFEGKRCENDIDECKKDGICGNGICQNTPGSFRCFCTPGYTGLNCDLDVDECLSHPCKNNAECQNKQNDYECICPAGYTGKDCSVDIDECESNPCSKGSSCVDQVANFTCMCVPGMTGRLCEIDIDDCESQPCQNGGRCIDQLGGFQCDCNATGYSGIYCQTNINECESNPCTNGAECVDKINDYQCNCFPGYTGKNCEEDIDECESVPCLYGGTCLQRSNYTLYQPLPIVGAKGLPVHFAQPFSYSIAAGYECICVPGTMGTNCETNINECESNPCKNGGCVDGVGNYTCECDPGFEGSHCETDIDECLKYRPCVHGTCMDGRNNYICDCDGLWGGKNCSVQLTGCVNEPCLNGGTCVPYLENETQHKFNCSCHQGFQGKTCDTVTTMSLVASSLLVVNTTRDEGYDIQLRFKTTLPNGILAFGNGATSYILVLNNGRLNLHSALLNRWDGVFIGSELNNSKWQKVFVAINSSHLVLSANDEQTIYPINSYEGTNGSNTSFPITYLGGTIPSLAQPYLKHIARAVSSFVGCMEDVVINGQWVLPGQEQEFTKLHNIDTGCPRTPQCDPNPCHSNGHCTDLWHTFSCSCQRPHLGHTCKYNITAATFGHENTTNSAVKVTVSDVARRAIRSVLDISMFIRTRKPSGQVFYLGSDPDNQNVNANQSPSDDSYVAAFLSKGELLVRMIFNDTPEGYTVGGNKLDNGYLHLIEVIRNSTLIQVKLNGTEYFRKTLSTSGQLNAQVLYLGGPPPNADTINSLYKDDSEKQYFKGIIQDVQVSNGSHAMIVELYPLDNETEGLELPAPFGQVTIDRNSVLEGIVSDDLCRSQPCYHDAYCENTWNDFICTCPRGYKGKYCQDIQFCELQKCPMNATCQNLDAGYECISNMTFHDDKEPLVFTFDEPDRKDISMDTIEISYRTKFGGTLLYVHDGDMYFEISTIRQLVTISWLLSGDLPETHRFERELAGDDDSYDWHTLLVKVSQGGKLEAGWKGWETAIDPQPSLTADIDYFAFRHLFSGRQQIYIGGMPEMAHIENNSVVSGGIDKGSSFKGCLGETRVGGFLLPYFPHELIYPDTFNLTQGHFKLNSSQPEQGCILCFQQSCKNGGICSNPSEQYACECPAGYESDDCSQNIDECLSANCLNGATCVDGVASFTCQCLEGYEGQLCEIEINECDSNPCHNGGVCQDLLAGFSCTCTEEYAGPQCDVFRLVTCDNMPCRNGSRCVDGYNMTTGNNFTCTCSAGFAGPLCDKPFCQEVPCQHGTCDTEAMIPKCICDPGYVGMYCETEVNECESAPCLNGGQCIDFVNEYRCNCTGTGFDGKHCEHDINECLQERISCGGRGHCINTEGSFRCHCEEGMCGKDCAQSDPCQVNPNVCLNGGICVEDCDRERRYYCNCTGGYTGVNCSEQADNSLNEISYLDTVYYYVHNFVGSATLEAEEASGADIALIVVPVVIGILTIAGALIGTFLVMARNKRATRGTYSPSAQEYCNPRLEMDNVLKPPPEERLI